MNYNIPFFHGRKFPNYSTMIHRKLYRPEINFGYNTSQKFCSVGVIENYGGGGGGKPPFF
jgi:hypothetical protein